MYIFNQCQYINLRNRPSINTIQIKNRKDQLVKRIGCFVGMAI